MYKITVMWVSHAHNTLAISAISRRVMCFRYVVVINGNKAIREALVVKSIDFADRLDFYSSTVVPERAKG